MDNNKVNVTIFGKEYVIAGDKNTERILNIAAHVDNKMQEMSNGFNGPASELAVLTALNIADEYMDAESEIADVKKENDQIVADTQHYEQLWEEAKKTFIVFKQENQDEIDNLTQQKDELQSRLNEKDRELDEMMKERENVKKQFARDSEVKIEETETKYKDIENNFFDLQMENIQLKSELEKLKNKLEWENNERESH